MNNYIEEFNFEERSKNSYQIIKIVLMMVIIFVLGTIIIRSCSRIFDNNGILDEKKLKEETKYNMDKPFSELGIHSQPQLEEYLYEVSKYLKPKEFQNIIDWDDLFGKSKLKFGNWDAYENGWQVLEQKFEWRTHDELIRRVVYKGNDWSILPLSEKFREKFKEVSIPEYYGYTDDRVYRGEEEHKWIMLDIYNNGTTFSFEELTGNGNEANKVYFKCYYDEDGYLDDIVLTDVVPYLDKYGWYVTKKDSYLMNKVRWVETILKYILPNKSYNYLEGNAGWQPLSSPYYFENVWQEIGMTDRFREYFNSLDGKGLLPEILIKDTSNSRKTDRLNIENIDIDNCYAEAICEISKDKKVKHYDIHWTTDDEYRLDSLDVKLNYEEDKKEK